MNKLEKKVDKCVRYLESMRDRLSSKRWPKKQDAAVQRTITRINGLLANRDDLRSRMLSGVTPDKFIASYGGVIRSVLREAERS